VRVPFVASSVRALRCVSGLWILLFGASGSLFGQIGGRSVYELILNNSPAPRVTALGGRVVSLIDSDPNLALYNPAMLSDSMDRRLSLNYTNSYGGISSGYLSYAHHKQRIGTFHGGLNFANYGNMTRYDEFGNPQGTFTGNDIAAVVGYSRAFGPFRAGINTKLIYSQLEAYSSLGMAFDFGAGYFSTKYDLGVGLVLRNAGFQMLTYTKSGKQEPLPLELLVGISKGVPRTPLRFSLTFQQLNRPGLITDNPNIPATRDLNGNLVKSKVSIADQVFSHMIFQVELLFGKLRNVQIRLAYNHQKRVEFALQNQSLSLAGFSFGAGVRIKMFYIDYGFVAANVIGNVHQVSLSCFLNRFGSNYKPPTPPRAAYMPARITREVPADVAPAAPSNPLPATEPVAPAPKKVKKAKKDA
jgi:hypothetical protein